VLSRNERALGADSRLVVSYATWVDYRSDRSLGAYGVRTPRSVARRFVFGVTSPFTYDVLHYYFGRSFLSWDDFGGPNWLWFRDLRLARRLGKRVFMTLQGCDVRVSRRSAEAYAVTPCQFGHCTAAPTCRATIDDQREELVRTIVPLCDRVFVLNPELARYVPGSTFLPYASVDVDALKPEWPRTDGPIRIVHAPSDEGIKGSALISAAVERLRERHPIEYTVVAGVPHHVALGLYRAADLVVDQVLTGWYGGLAVETMAMGKPTAAFIREEDLDVVPERMRAELPILQLRRDNLEQDLEAIILERARWPEWARRARAFVEAWHHPRKIAASMLRAYEQPNFPVGVG
jgi:hypothetical protein